MNNPSQKSKEAHEKFLAFLVASMGADITAPDGVLNQEMESFKEIRNVEDDDEAVDALVAVSRTESQQGRLEIVQILCMRLLTLNNCSKLAAFLREYTHHMLDYLNEHPEHRDQNPQEKAMDAIKGMFGDDL